MKNRYPQYVDSELFCQHFCFLTQC